MKRSYYILILLAISFAFLAIFKLSSNSSLQSFALSILSSGLFATFIEIGFYVSDRRKYAFLHGGWVRRKLLNRNGQPSGNGYDPVAEYEDGRVDPKVTLTYRSEGEYSGAAFYTQGKVNFTLVIDRSNVLSGKGTYQYEGLMDANGLPDAGHFDFIIDADKRSIYIQHENVLPSGNAKGTEIWSRNNQFQPQKMERHDALRDERNHMEGLLNQRFGYFIAIVGLIAAAIPGIKSFAHLRLVFCLGAAVEVVLAFLLFRAQRKLNVSIRMLSDLNDVSRDIADEANKGYYPSSFSVRNWLGYWTPAIVIALLIFSAVGSLFFPEWMFATLGLQAPTLPGH